MVGAAQGVLDVAENRIHPSKLGALDRDFSATHHHRLMNAAGCSDAMKAGQPIGDDPSACTEVELRPGGDFGETEALDDGELHAQRVSVLVGLGGGDKGRLAGRAKTAFAPASLATEIGIVELDRPAESVRTVALHHHLHQLVPHAPRRVVGDAQMAVQLHRRDAFLVLGHEVDGLEPQRRRELGGVEDGACGNRGLAVAAIALLELSAVELAAAVMATVRAQKPTGPSPLVQGVEALVFGSVEREECVEADSLSETALGCAPWKFPFLSGNCMAIFYPKCSLDSTAIRKLDVPCVAEILAATLSLGISTIALNPGGCGIRLVNFNPTRKYRMPINHRGRSGTMRVKPGSVQQPLNTERRYGNQAFRTKRTSAIKRFLQQSHRC